MATVISLGFSALHKLQWGLVALLLKLHGTCEFLSWSHTCPQPGPRVGPETAGSVWSPVTSITASAVRGNLGWSAHWVRVKSEHCYCDQVMKRQGVDCCVCAIVAISVYTSQYLISIPHSHNFSLMYTAMRVQCVDESAQNALRERMMRWCCG